MKKAKWLSALLAGAMMMTVIPATALATESGNGTGETIEIDSNDDLIAAIKNQKDNQVWSIAPRYIRYRRCMHRCTGQHGKC